MLSDCFSYYSFFTKYNDFFLPNFLGSSLYKMVDINSKQSTKREAFVVGEIFVGCDIFFLIKEKKLPKGDVLYLVESSSIHAVKRVSELLTLSHPLNVSSIFVKCYLRSSDFTLVVCCYVSAKTCTGVEMEALVGVTIGLLTIYDLIKMFNLFIFLSNTRILVKNGGKSGLLINCSFYSDIFYSVLFMGNSVVALLCNLRIAVLSIGFRVHILNYIDSSGLLLCSLCKKYGASLTCYKSISDDEEEIMNEVRSIAQYKDVDVIIITGGTGISKHDCTSVALQKICVRSIPGIAEMLRFYGSKYSVFSWLSCSYAGLLNNKLLIAIPGNSNAVFESFFVLLPILKHAVYVINK